MIHQTGQLPMVADIRELPAAGDANLLCTNMRTVDGKRPTFVDHSESWFLIPMITIRFIEVPREAMAGAGQDDDYEPIEVTEPAQPEPVDEGPAEPDEDLLARIRNI